MYMVFNVRSDGVVDGVYGITDQAPTSDASRKFVREGRQLPENLFGGRALTGVTVYVYRETDRQFKPSLFYVLMSNANGPQFEIRKKSDAPVLDDSMAIR